MFARDTGEQVISLKDGFPNRKICGLQMKGKSYMYTLLAKLFIRDKNNRTAYGMLSGILGIALNIMLFVGKYIAGVISGSVAVTADAFNNLSDAGSSLITLLGFKLSARKPDREHPFGHGRIEYLSGFAVSAAILLMGVELLKTSIEKIVNPEPVDAGLLPMLILVASIAVKLYMAFYNTRYGRQLDSVAMRATAADSLSDSAATSVVLVSMLLLRITGFNADPYGGALVALFILWSGWNAAKDTIKPLLGSLPDPKFVDEIERIVSSHPEIVNMHDLVVHDYGPGRQMVSLHAEVPGDGDIFVLHDAIDSAEREITEKLGCNAVIHMDPIETDDDSVSQARQELAKLAAQLDPRITVHDLRIVTGPTHTNLIFDAVIPQDIEISDAEIKEKFSALVAENFDKRTFAVIHIDRPYI